MSALQKKVMRGGLPSRPPLPGSRGGGGGGRLSAGRVRDYSPTSWTLYWDKKEVVEVSGDRFTLYSRGQTGPIVCLLHGGGYSALTWSVMSKVLTDLVECRVLALDLRGHGETVTADDGDLCLSTLAADVVRVLGEVCRGQPGSDVVLMGHSMGGTVAVAVGEMGVDGLAGMVVEDVVEGTAMESLASMQGFLRSRPDRFGSVGQAVEWCVRSGQVRNLESARVSMPGQISHRDTGRLAAADVAGGDLEEAGTAATPATAGQSRVAAQDSIMEEEEEDEAEEKGDTMPPPPEAAPDRGYTWRIDLSATEPHWSGWFRGLSARFLGVPTAKLLLLAGVDRLDRDLTVGQMQGKFQMQVLPQVGHAVHEDSPDKVAEVLATFLTRNKLATTKDSFTPTFPAC